MHPKKPFMPHQPELLPRATLVVLSTEWPYCCLGNQVYPVVQCEWSRGDPRLTGPPGDRFVLGSRPA
ncbi:unnamed protein product [Protopolystoma xenopodis]|uniref:Uncharacterized protein n=1 Tax=Protopolystoma xenopodis TaxID=117903 RepID=A0A3S5CMG4_9PLAT|nr:unnamed protein product [Protopolystoma xenopodis]